MKLIMALMLLLLAGCQPLMPNGSHTAVPVVSSRQTSEWMTTLSETLGYSQEQAETAYRRFDKQTLDQPLGLFRYAMINQQLNDRLGWIRARDSLRKLLTYQLPDNLAPTMQVLLLYNQQMINTDARNSRLLQAIDDNERTRQQLQQQLTQSEQQLQQLRDKLQALKDVETSLSKKRSDSALDSGE